MCRQDILDNCEFRHQVRRLSRADALGTLIEQRDLSACGAGILL